jgi:RND family efflux transporter MFP subunit
MFPPPLREFVLLLADRSTRWPVEDLREFEGSLSMPPASPRREAFPGLREARRLAAVLAASAALSACDSAKTAPPPPPPEVSVASVIAREVGEWDEFTGRLEAVETAEVRPRVSGAIVKVFFTEGAEVRQGAPLFLIDPRPYEATLERARAELLRAETRAELAATERARAEKLLTARAISHEEMDQRGAAEREAQAEVRAARAAVTTAELDLTFAHVDAPIAGRVGRAEITVGNVVNAGFGQAPLLTTVVSLDPIYASFEGDEHSFLRFGAQQRAGRDGRGRVRVDEVFMGLANEQGHPHQGRLDFLDNRLDPASGTIRARAVFDNRQRLFTPGLFARLKVRGSAPYAAILVQDSAIGTDQDKRFVLRVDAGDQLAYQPVVLGPLVDGLRVVRQGLKAGDRIVVNGLQRVRPGMAVKAQVQPMEPPAAVTEAALPRDQGGR